MNGTHECPARICTRQVDVHMLMCRAHWYMVPQPLRRAVYAAWDGGRGAGTRAHADAIIAAVDAVNGRLPQENP